MINNNLIKLQNSNKAFPQITLQSIRDLVYQGSGSIIPQYKNRFKSDSLMVARFTETHEGAPYALDLVAFKDSEEKRYLIEMYLGSKEINKELENRVLDDQLYLVVGINGVYKSSKLSFIAWVNIARQTLLVETVYDRNMLVNQMFTNTERSSIHFQVCPRR